jgi:hypothetical protein
MSGYCDDTCDRPDKDHDGLCYGSFSKQVWRVATDDEIATFEKEIADKHAAEARNPVSVPWSWGAKA